MLTQGAPTRVSSDMVRAHAGDPYPLPGWRALSMGPTVIPRTGVLRSHTSAERGRAKASHHATTAKTRTTRNLSISNELEPPIELIDETVTCVANTRHHCVGAHGEKLRFGIRVGYRQAKETRALGRLDAGQRIFDDECALRSLETDAR